VAVCVITMGLSSNDPSGTTAVQFSACSVSMWYWEVDTHPIIILDCFEQISKIH